MFADEIQLRQIFLQQRPLVALRAPEEFAKGAFPGAVNLPLMTDSERAQVGTCYKRDGQQAAIELGHSLVNGDVREQRIQQWRDYAKAHPQVLFYCFRGGLRSQTVGQWLQDSGLSIELIDGGYKRLRQFMITETERLCLQMPALVISGFTGVGKTEVIHQLNFSVDLEGLANHHGSSFGRQLTPQPTQINFENALAIEWLKVEASGAKHALFEDEGRMVGSRSIPESLIPKLQSAPIVQLTDSLESRTERIFQTYIVDAIAQYRQLDPQNAVALFSEQLKQSLQRIAKRLGGVRFAELYRQLEYACAENFNNETLVLHKDWIRQLLHEYYDPMYDYQINKKKGQLIFKGPHSEVVEFLKSQCQYGDN